MARKLMFLGVAAAGAFLAGCRSYDTPRTLRGSERPDQPGLSTEEQYRRGRARYPLIEDDYRVGPRTYSDRPGNVGGGYNNMGAGSP